MIALLPAALKPLFEKRRAFIVERAVDPDMWRNAGFETEPPNHFLDMDHEAFGPYPFEGLPRDYDARGPEVRPRVHRRAGAAAVADGGVLRPPAAGLRVAEAAEPARLRARQHRLLLGHPRALRADGHVPLHAVVNYDGQLTHQQGCTGAGRASCSSATGTALRIAPVAADTGVASRATSCSMCCWPATGWRPACSSRQEGRGRPRVLRR